ncbi:putative alanine and proline rich protein [Mycolicibacterium rhodesiae JS60]|nr:putative alanine and proline rich protein [Mycolicibacterium rhodesiae JS60]
MTVDVAARLAEGRPSASDTQAYVSACHAVGYQHPDLTAHGSQVVEWYCSEDGLDLRALDADCTALRAAAATADEAARLERDGQATLSAAWQGESGSVAADFLDRHCATGAAVARALHAAVAACETLRDVLGRLVDEKVSAAMSIDERRAGERPAWLAAAATVTSGGAARDEAVEVVTAQITPYVDADIRTEWVAAMRSATASVTAAYEDAIRQLSASPAVHFEVPGQFGPPIPVPAAVPAAAAPAAVATAPAAAIPTPSATLPPPVAEPLPATAPEPPPPSIDTGTAQPVPPAPPPAEPPAGMAAMPDAAGGLSGLVGQIADVLGGLFDGLPDTAANDDVPGFDDPVEQDDDTPDDDVVDPDTDVPEEIPVTEEAAAEEPQPVEEPPLAATAPPPPEPEPEPLAAEQPEQPDEQTPCEIAADELAQVGQ